MIRTLNVPTEICTNQLLSIPIDSRWIWDEKNKELVYESRHKINKQKKFNTNEILKIDIRTGYIHYRKQYRPLQKIIKTKDNNKIILDDVIQASLNVMSEKFYIPIEFEDYVNMSPVQDFLFYILNYFYWYFETMNNASPKKDQHIDRSETEKHRIRISYAHLLAALHELSCKYAVLLLGINLKNYHHMRNGDLFYSCNQIDRNIYESLFIFLTYFIWITFYRQHFDLIRIELARLFRAGDDIDVFNIPTREVNENIKRINNDESIDSMNRHKLIDCTEFLSKSMVKKAATGRTSDVYDRKISIQPTSSIFWYMNETSDKPNSLLKNRPSKSLLERDFNEQEKIEENDELYAYELYGRSPYYRQKHKLLVSQRNNRMRGILSKQLKSRNKSLIDEQYYRLKEDKKRNQQANTEDIKNRIHQREKMKKERLAIQRLINSSTYTNSSLLPAPPNPLDDSHKMKAKQTILPAIEFKLKEYIGIIGQPYSDFDLIRLTLKPHIEDNITTPEEFLVTLPIEINNTTSHPDQIIDSNLLKNKKDQDVADKNSPLCQSNA